MMKTNNEIEHIVNDVLTKYVKRGGVYKVFSEIMLAENIKLREIPSLSSDFVGALTMGNNNQVYIMINKNIDNLGRKHFTLAHELGHYFLQHQLHQNSVFCGSNDIVEEGLQQNPIEREANYFASCLLMPEDKIKPAFIAILANASRYRIQNFLLVKNDFTFGIWAGIRDQLTKRYGVSEAALRYRLQQLKLARFEFTK
ncbi:ImmA/IrrE family metallo-endopeptidase [Empedobacter falsenii]|uniref:ImmA/IrrE family metallo-endopeptidase n=1 Tax=Empedobacter falsenii TaxID=343874 RepID=UPI00257491C1|nr:ImmA/IrrE family metallo-endopeptidase [Empedobacter falsenii]MDM1299852.1 ImmA/IrrE family metallo-endopeptidase [Empedobacter falsenii]MDM1319646.1 ImmA/IrrE family metallo-endopeptidase [Empedobacter falsenii]